MKKAGIFAAVIAVVLLFMHFYNYRLYGYTDDTMYVIDAEQAAQYLKNGVKEGENADFDLTCYQSSTPLYARGSKYFIGEEYHSLNTSYPVYVNEGSFLYSFSDEMNLISTEFTQLNAYDGLYVAEGHSYNRDRQLADPDEFILLSTESGFHMNVQDMVIHSQTRKYQVPVNSLMNLEKEKIAYYHFDEGRYVYEEYKDLIGAEVTIGSLSISYEELIAALKELEESPEKDQSQETISPKEETAEETSEEAASEIIPMVPEEGSASEETAAAEEREAKEQGSEESEEAETMPADSGEEAASSETREVLPDHPPIPGDRIQWEFPDSGEEGDGGNGDGMEENKPGGSGEEGGSGDGSGGDSGEEGGSGGESQNPFQKPEAALGKFQFSVYTADASLTITDPTFLIDKGVRLVFYKEGESRASYRKLYRTSGDIAVEPLVPDTEYEVEGYFDYYHPQYGKIREVFLERSYQGKTLPVSALPPLQVAQEPDSFLFANGVQIKNFKVTNGNETEEGTPSSARALELDTSKYISSVQMHFEKQGTVGWNSPHVVLSTSLTAALKRGEAIVWKTADILDSNSRYTYELSFYDRFGNALPVSVTSEEKGTARTSKLAPEAELRVSQSSDVNRLELKTEIINKDKAEFTDGRGKVYPYLYVTRTDRPDAPVFFTLEGEDEEISRYELKKNTENLVFTSLLPSTSYTIWVKGSFDLEDGQTYEDQVIGKVLTTTDSLASLGTVNFMIEAGNVKSTSAEITARLRTQINSVLQPFISELVFDLEQGNEKKYSYVFEKEILRETTVLPGESYTLETGSQELPAITVSLPEGSDPANVWDALLTNGTLKVSFKDGTLHSASAYKAVLHANAVRGGSQGSQVKEDVTGRYYQTSFQTMKMPVYVSYEMSFVNGSTATFYNTEVHDPDKVVVNGNIIVRLRMKSNSKVVEVRSYTVDQLNALGELSFNSLEEGTSYVVEVVAQEYNEGYTNSTKYLQKLLYLKDGSEIAFKVENSLWGSLTMDSMKNGYASQKPEDGVGIESANLFDMNEAVLGRSVGTDGSLQAHTSNSASGFMRVEQETVYLVGGGLNSNIKEYDENQRFLRYFETAGAYKPSADAVYVRTTLPTTDLATAYLSRALFAEQDSKTNMIKPDSIITGKYVNTSGQEVNLVNGACTDFIEVEPLVPYVRLEAADRPTPSWTKQGIFFYDEEKKLLSAVSGDAVSYQATPPAGAKYMRFNMLPDYADRVYLGRKSDIFNGPNLLEKARWNDGMTVTWDNKYTVNQYNYYRYCDYIPVQETAVYRVVGSAGIQVFDSRRQFLGYFDSNGSYHIRMPENAAYIRMNVNFREDYSVKPELRQVTPPVDRGSVTMGVRVKLSDENGQYLGEQPEFMLEYQVTDAAGNQEQWTESYQVDPGSHRYDALQFIDAEPGCQYAITQTVTIGGNRIVLDSVSVGTAKTANIIKSESGLKAVRYAPMDAYIVVEDMEINSQNFITYLYGSIDFRGHEIKMKEQYTLISTICGGAVVENLVADIRMDSPYTTIASRGLVCTNNRGTIRNSVLRMSVDNKQNNASFGGFSYQNYGVIDRFAVELTGNVYGRAYVGAAAGYNYGQITNGYLVSEDAYRFTVDAAASGATDRTARGGLVGINRDGRMENLYSAVVMEENHTGTEPPASTAHSGMITGYTVSEVRNVFGVGMTLSNGLPWAKEGPAVGTVTVSPAQIGNINYVETMAFSGSRYANIYNNQVTASSLWDQTWVDHTINGDSAFLTAMAADGYYPQVDMPEAMAGKQPVMRLPSQYTTSEPRILAMTVLEQDDKTARVKIDFENRSHLFIHSMDIAVMDMDSANQRVFTYGAEAEVLEQGIEEDGTYYAVIEIKNPVRYRSKYYISSYTVGIKDNPGTNYQVTPPEREKTEMAISFYREIANLDQWRDAFYSKNIDSYGNYRLKAREFDFGYLKPIDYKTNYLITAPFYGNIDGSFVDENGNSQVAVLKNINLGTYNSLIDNLKGSLKNIRVENLVIDREKTTKTAIYRGLIRVVSGGVVDHVQIDQGEIYGPYRTGVLAGYVEQGGVISNCSVTNSSITTYMPSGNYKANAGGITSLISNSSIVNSFVENLEIDNTIAMDSEGIGGIAGTMGTNNSMIKNCYATGIIRSGFRNVGGIVGKAASTASVSNCYSKVNIDTYGTFAGGIIGYLEAYDTLKGNLSMGNLFVHSSSSDGIHRLAGYSVSGKFQDNFGFDGQMFNNRVDASDSDDLMTVLSETELREEDTYYDQLKWSGNDFAFQWEHEGAAQGIRDGYMPLLKDTSGALLPDQTPVLIGSSKITVEKQIFAINQKASSEYSTMFPGMSAPFSQAYELVFHVSYDDSRYELLFEEASMEGMELNVQMNRQNTYSFDKVENYFRVRFPFVTSQLGGDVYCLNLVFQDRENPDIRIMVSTAMSPASSVEMEIRNAAEWNRIMEIYGNTYGNFLLTGDIDASQTGGKLVSNVKINKLTSTGNYGIKNIKYEVNGNRDALISSCLSEISNITFENIDWTVPESRLGEKFENIGIIGMNQGVISNVKFKDINILSGTGMYTGCIGYSLGTLKNIDLTDIVIESKGTRVGGLVGYTIQSAEEIRASGTMEETDGTYRSSYSITGAGYVGGITGAGGVNNRSEITGAVITGTGANVSRIGGMMGEGPMTAAGQSTEENQQLASRASDLVVQVKNCTGNEPTYAGGIAGVGNVQYAFAENCLVDNQEGSYAGGASGSGYMVQTEVSSVSKEDNPEYTVPATEIRAKSYAGGVAGTGYGNTCKADRLTVEALMNYAGGIFGRSTSTTSTMTADRMLVKAPVGAGGIVGEFQGAIVNSLLSRSAVKASGYNTGGIGGENTKNVASVYGNGVIYSEISAGENAGTGEGNAGGIVGSYPLAGDFYANYAIHTKVEAAGDNVGGLTGYGAGGSYTSSYSTASVKGKRNVGGMIGMLVGEQSGADSNFKKAVLGRSYSFGDVTAEENGAGFVGFYTSGPNQAVVPNRENTYGLLALGSVTVDGNSGIDLFLNMEKGLAWQGKSLRVFSDAQLNGQKAFELPEFSNGDFWWDSYKPETAGGTGTAGSDKLYQKLLVTAENLYDSQLYSNTFEQGGMDWIPTGKIYWDFDGLGYMEEKEEAGTGYKPTVMVTVNQTPVTIEDPLVAVYTVPDDEKASVTVQMDAGGEEYEWYRVKKPNYVAPFSSLKIKVHETPLAGRGYYVGRMKREGKTLTTPIIKITTEGYLPYITYGSNACNGQEGLNPICAPGIDDENPLKLYDGTDKLYYGGIAIPEGTGGPSSQTDLEALTGEITVYPSGAGTVNIDLGNGYEGFDRIQVLCGDQLICDTAQMQRVYTADYDYRRPLTVMTFAGTEKSQLSVDSTMLRRTVMVWGDAYYYTCDGGVNQSSEKILDVPVLHLYGGKALGEDGRIYDLENGASKEFKLSPWNSETETVPLWEDTYEGSSLKVFGSFTEIDGEMIREQQLLVKNGTLYSLSGSSVNRGFVVDDYNGQIFASFLEENGRLSDLGDPLHTPDEFNRKDIAHMSMSAGSSQPYLLVRYVNGAAKGFNYVTGEELEIENAFTDVSFLDFAAGFAGDFFGADERTSKEFADLKKLEEQLTLSPITEGQLADAFAAAGEEGSQASEDMDENAAEAVKDGEGSESRTEGEGSESRAEGEGSESRTEGEGSESWTKGEGSESWTEGEGSESREEAEGKNAEAEKGSQETRNLEAESVDAMDQSVAEAQTGNESTAVIDLESNIEAEAASDLEAGNGTEASSDLGAGDEAEAASDLEAGNEAEVPSDLEAGNGTEVVSDPKSGSEVSADDIAETNAQPKAADNQGMEAEANGSKNMTHPEGTESDVQKEGLEKAAGTKGTKGIKDTKVTYVYSFHTDSQTSQLYNAGDLLTKKEEELLTEQSKVELLKSAGMVTEDYITPMSLQSEELKKGVLMFGFAVILALGLSGILIYRRRKY